MTKKTYAAPWLDQPGSVVRLTLGNGGGTFEQVGATQRKSP